MKIILKVTIVSSKNGTNNSRSKHVKLGDSIYIDKDEHIERIDFNDVKMVYNLTDVEEIRK